MSKLFLRFSLILWVFIVPCWTLAASDVALETQTQTQVTANYPTIRCNKVEPLTFCGIPNEAKTGEVKFKVLVSAGCEKLLVTVTGSAFEKDESCLDTEYQTDDCDSWYKAGIPFPIWVVAGRVNTIRYRAVTGPTISSQQAGDYSATLSFVVVPPQK